MIEVIITCRSPEKGAASKERLTQLTKRDIFEVVTMDLTDLGTVKAALEVLRREPVIDGVVLNAGGAGGGEPKALTAEGVTNCVAANVLGNPRNRRHFETHLSDSRFLPGVGQMD